MFKFILSLFLLSSFSIQAAEKRNLDLIKSGITSPNANSAKKYISSFPLNSLRKAKALNPEIEAILVRMSQYTLPKNPLDTSGQLSVERLLFVEEPARYATFLPKEKLLFPKIWDLLAIDDSLDLDADGDFLALDKAVAKVQPIPGKLDLDARYPIAKLPEALQEIAYRIAKPVTVSEDTISYQEVVTALSEYERYVSSEYFYFGSLLRAIEALSITPNNFPHLAILRDLNQVTKTNIAGIELSITRTASQYISQHTETSIRTQASLKFSGIEQNALIATWTPLASNTSLKERYSNTGAILMPTAGVEYQSAGVALLQVWKAGVRIAQQVVVSPQDEGVTANGYAIASRGVFTAIPYKTETDSLPNTVTLPSGRYEIPAGVYGTAVLNIYGLGLMKLEIGGKSFWQNATKLDGYSRSEICWDLTELGPTNMVTGAYETGPAISFRPGNNEVYFGEHTYCVGRLQHVATLSPENRL